MKSLGYIFKLKSKDTSRPVPNCCASSSKNTVKSKIQVLSSQHIFGILRYDDIDYHGLNGVYWKKNTSFFILLKRLYLLQTALVGSKSYSRNYHGNLVGENSMKSCNIFFTKSSLLIYPEYLVCCKTVFFPNL